MKRVSYLLRALPLFFLTRMHAAELLQILAGQSLFSPTFKELSTPQAQQLLTPAIDKKVLKKLVAAVKLKRLGFSREHFDPYPTTKNELGLVEDSTLLLTKIALMVQDELLLRKLITTSSSECRASMFSLILYEADPAHANVAESFLRALQPVAINSTDELGLTPLAVAAVIRKSPELTQILLSLNPNVNYFMTGLFPGTVLNLVKKAFFNETNPGNIERLAAIYTLLTSKGAK